jgi:thymidylate synthase
VLDEVVLPACHLLYQLILNPTTRKISLCLYLRSNDIGLGAGFNAASTVALLHLIGRLAGDKPRFFSYFIGSAHIYENHPDMLHEQLKHELLPLPDLVLSDRNPDYAVTRKYEPEWLDKVEPSDFMPGIYRHHAPLTAPRAVRPS